MSADFPIHSQSAKLGDRGVAVVSRIVNERLNWLFVRRHQEHDFGIDGQIEYITEAGQATGQAFGVQIKYGKSFFQEKNRWGYVYRGEKRHFNYLSNYPLPVLILIVHPDQDECYWAPFSILDTESTGEGWKLTIPFTNKLVDAKQFLEARLGEASNRFAELQEYWEENKQIKEAPAVYLALDRDEDVRKMDTSFARQFFDRLLVNRELAAACQGKVEISFSGYGNDYRDLFEIPEVRKYVAHLDIALPELFFFHRTESPTSGLFAIALCLTSSEWEGERSTPTVVNKLSVDFTGLADFMDRHFDGLNKLAEWVDLSEEEIQRISFAVAQCLKIPLEAGDDRA